MNLSIVIICWNDRKVIADCLESIYRCTRRTEFEIIVSDNGSTDDSLAFIRHTYPQVRIVENHANLGFARGNNAGIRSAAGQYVLILNPDTVIHDGALDKWVEFADLHPEVGAFGCRVLNTDGSYQHPARPFPTIGRYWVHAFRLDALARLIPAWRGVEYSGWDGDTERPIDWQSGCAVLLRGNVLRPLKGFDERFFYHFEEVDLCRRVWDAGHSILHCPSATITHLGGQSVGRFRMRFEVEVYRNRYRYFHKHFGIDGTKRCQRVSLAHLRVRRLGYSLKALFRPTPELRSRLQGYRELIDWNRRLDVEAFVTHGAEPASPYEPFSVPATTTGN